MELITITNLLQMETTALLDYCNRVVEIENNRGWDAQRLFNSINQLKSALSLSSTTVDQVLQLEVPIMMHLVKYVRVNTSISWDIMPANQNFTEGHEKFVTWVDADGYQRFSIMSEGGAATLYTYLDALDEDGDTEFVEELTDPNRVAERRRIREIVDNYNRVSVCQSIEQEGHQWFEQYLRRLNLWAEGEPAVEEEIIPANSETLLVREETSRFSSATWYQAIQDKIITLAGVGGIGSYVGFLLARMHPKSMFLYDDDNVESANMSGQLYGRSDIGLPKVEALSKMIDNYANYESAFAINGRFVETSEASDIMICGFDNMAARKLFFMKWTEHVYSKPEAERKHCLFIDGRLAAEELQVLAFTGDNEWAINEYRSKFLFSDEEADATVCSYKQTTYMANLIGSLMVNIFVNFVANEVAGWDDRDVPFFTSYDGLTMFFKTQNHG